MKKNLLFASLLMMFASCSKDATMDDLSNPNLNNEGTTYVTITTGIEPPAKDEISVASRASTDYADPSTPGVEYDYTWDEGDQLAAVAKNSNSATALSMEASSVGTASAIFSGEVANEGYYLVHPYNSAVANPDYKAYPIDISNQTDDWKSGYMVGLSTDGAGFSASDVINTNMQHICGMITLNIDLSDADAKSALAGYNLTKLYVTDVPVSGTLDLSATNIDQCLTNSTKNGTITVTTDKAIADLIQVGFDILPFDYTSSQEYVTIKAEFTNGSNKKYCNLDLEAKGSEVDFDRNTFNVLNTTLTADKIVSHIAVKTIADLKSIGQVPGAKYQLTNNIDLTEELESGDWTPLCPEGFDGVFDGNGKTIKGLSITTTPEMSTIHSYKALFYKNSASGTIENLNLTDCEIIGRDYVAGVVAINEGEVSGCTVSGTISGSQTVDKYGYIGSIVAKNSGSIDDCISSADVTGSQYVGGIAGGNDASGTISNSNNSGSVSGSENYVGGIVGNNKGSVDNCNNTNSEATVSGVTYLGGIAGGNSNRVTNSDNAAAVSGTSSIGGVVGINSGDVIESNNSGSVTGTGNFVGGIVGNNTKNITGCNNTNSASTVSGNDYVGGIVGGSMGTGNIDDCDNAAKVSGHNDVGGIVGNNGTDDIVANCENTGAVNGTDKIGGIVGLNNNGDISNNTNRGSVEGTNYIGGVVGSNIGGTISDSSNYGNVTGTNYIGGVIGYNTGTVSNCQNKSNSTISGIDHIGGIIGGNTGTVNTCTNLGIVNGRNDVGGIVGNNGTGDLVIDCQNHGTVTGVDNTSIEDTIEGPGADNIGGVVGQNNGGTVKHCYSQNVNITSTTGEHIGGVIGYLNEGYCISCYNISFDSTKGVITGDSYVGGVVGYSDAGTFIVGCYNEGNVAAKSTIAASSCAGGVVGYRVNNGTSSNVLKACYNVGQITQGTYKGGVIGFQTDGVQMSTSPNFYLIKGDGVMGQSSATITEGTDNGDATVGVTDAQLKGNEDFTAYPINGSSYSARVLTKLNEGIRGHNDSESNDNNDAYEFVNTAIYPKIQTAN